MYEPRISISSRSISYYEYYHGERRKSNKVFNPYLRKGTYQNSHKVYKRIKSAVNTLIDTAQYKTVYVASTGTYFRYKINFITLTLSSPQRHDDSYIIKNMLSKFLEAWAKRRAGLLYVWKAEIQDNGNIHFHITSNAFYHYKKLQIAWNKYQVKHGYLDITRVDTANSTDVHSVSKIKNLSTYLGSYFLKKDTYTRVLKRYHRRFKKSLKSCSDTSFRLPRNYFKFIKRKVVGTMWGCSKPLLSAKVSIYRNDHAIQDELRLLKEIDYMAVRTDYSLSYFFDHYPADSFPALYAHYKQHMKALLRMQHDSIISEVIDEL